MTPGVRGCCEAAPAPLPTPGRGLILECDQTGNLFTAARLKLASAQARRPCSRITGLGEGFWGRWQGAQDSGSTGFQPVAIPSPAKNFSRENLPVGAGLPRPYKKIFVAGGGRFWPPPRMKKCRTAAPGCSLQAQAGAPAPQLIDLLNYFIPQTENREP
jgi:hypothetical protein